MNELTSDELMLLVVMVKNDLLRVEQVIDKFGLSPGRENSWTDRNRLLAKLQIILEDRERIE